MKKHFKTLLSSILILLIVISSVACEDGAKIYTDVTLEDDFSGSRVMKLTINKGIFDEHFGGTVKDFKRILETTCPSQLTWTIPGIEEIEAAEVATEEETAEEETAEETTEEETTEETKKKPQKKKRRRGSDRRGNNRRRD